MRREPHKVKPPPLYCFPHKSPKSEPAACSKTRIKSPAWADSSGKSWLYNQKTTEGQVGVISIVSSMLDQAAEKQGGKVSCIWPKHLPLTFTTPGKEWDSRANKLALIALATLALNCLTHGKHVPHQNSASKVREQESHCRWEEKDGRGRVGKLKLYSVTFRPKMLTLIYKLDEGSFNRAGVLV